MAAELRVWISDEDATEEEHGMGRRGEMMTVLEVATTY
jgi:hypothetical protein